MSDVLKIAITGKMRAGKDAVADRLFYEHGFDFPKAFGTTLKHSADSLFPNFAKDGGKPRELYQKFGQLCRDIDPNVWIKHLAFSVEMALDSRSTKGVVISDLRQPNEFEWAKANGFTIIRVVASDETRLERAKAAGDSFRAEDFTHDTESHSDGFEVDYEINNDGDMDELEAQINAIITDLEMAIHSDDVLDQIAKGELPIGEGQAEA